MSENQPDLREMIRNRLDDHQTAEKFFCFLDRANAVDLEKMIHEVDDSDYALLDWVKAFLGFDEWLTNHHYSGRVFVDMLGYLHCCQMMLAESVNRPDFQSLVIQCLTDYGFDAVGPSQS